jgi:site-specific recombinase XerD
MRSSIGFTALPLTHNSSKFRQKAAVARSEQLADWLDQLFQESDLRTREHLTEAEVERLIKATQDNRYSHRDATMVLLAYRHGLRAAELVLGSDRLQDGHPVRP